MSPVRRSLIAGVAGALLLTGLPAVSPGASTGASAGVLAAPPAAQLAAPELVRSAGAALRWTPPILPADTPLVRYEVHRSRTAGFTPADQTLVGEVGPGTPATYQDTTAAPQAAFSYRVVTVVTTATGEQASSSDEVRVTTPAAGDAVLTVTAGSAGGGATEVRQLPDSALPCDDARNYGAAPTVPVGAEPGALHRALLRFDLRAVPPTATVHEATLRLPYAAGGQPVAVEVGRATRAWAEGRGPADGACDGSGASWLDAKGGVRWSQPGGDAAARPDASIPAADRTAAGTDTVQLTGLVAAWTGGRQANHGVLLRSADEGATAAPGIVSYTSDDQADPARRPTLTVSYADGSAPRGPRAVVSEPAAASRVHGGLRVAAAASDDGRVTGVEFLVDGRVAGTAAAAPYETTLDTTGLAGGGHALAIRATDDAGNASTSQPVPVTVDNTAPPSAAVTSPAGNALVTGPTAVTVTASDDVAVRTVDVLVDGTDIGEDDSAPFQVTWDPRDPLGGWYDGSHAITARVTDSSGQTRETAPTPVVLDRGNAAAHSARLVLGDPASTADDVIPAAVTENAAASAPVQDPYAGTVDADGVAGGSLGRSVKSAPVDSTGGASTSGCPAAAYCTTVNVTNTSTSTWAGSQVRLWYRWYADNGAILFEGPADGSLPAAFSPGASTSVGLRILPPKLPRGAELGRYHLRIDLYDQATGSWFALQGNKPVDNPVQVAKNLDDKLGLEKFWTYEGSETGAGSLALTNVANGNMLWRWSPWTSPGRGLATVLDITYNSLEDHSSSPLGNNVSLAVSGLTRFGEPLDIHPNKADQISGHSNKWVEFTDGDGTVHRFTGNDDGTWSRPPGVHLFLRTVSADPANPRYWALSRPDGVTFYF